MTYLSLTPTYRVSTPHTAAMNPGTTTIDLIMKAALANWADASLIAVWGAAGAQYTFYIEAGNLVIAWRNNVEANQFGVSTVVNGLDNGAMKWVRGLANPAAGTCDFYMGDNGSSWTALGAQHGGLSTLPISTAGTLPPLTLAGEDDDSGEWTGKLYRAKLIINGVTIIDMNWETALAGTGPWVATTGETWTATGGATVVDIAPVARAAQRSSVRRA